MAKIGGPLMSHEAHGQFGKNLIYSKRGSGQQVRDFHYPQKPISLGQRTQRMLIGLLTAQWQTMSAGAKAVYNDEVEQTKLQMSGFNLFVQRAQADLYTEHGLIAWYDFNEKGGATVFDHSGNGGNAELKQTYPANPPIRAESFLPEYGNCITLNGSDHYVDCGPSGLPEVTTALTVECWAYVEAYGIYVAKRQLASPSPASYIFYGGGAQYPRFRIYIGGVQKEAFYPGFVNNQWALFVGTYDNSFVRINVNGVSSAGVAATGDMTTVADTRLIGAQRYNGSIQNHLKGKIDCVRIYNRSLAPAEINKHLELLRFNKNRQPNWHP